MLTFLLMAFFNALIRPDKSPLANEQHLEIAKLKPLSKVSFLKVMKNNVGSAEGEATYALIPYTSIDFQEKRVKVKIKNTNGVEEFRFFAFIDVFYSVDSRLLAAAFRSTSDEFAFVDKLGVERNIRFSQLSDSIRSEATMDKVFLLGTDQYGRDMLSRLLAGTTISLGVGLLSVMMALLLGLVIGTISGYAGGMLDQVLSWLMNVFYSIPAILVVIGITLALGSGMSGVIIGIGFVLWVEMARVIRGEVISIRQKEYIKASRLMGLSNVRILFKHVLPNLSGPIIILSAGNFADAILMEAGLSFLGIGIQPPKPSWGGMIRELYGYIITDGAFLAVIPGIAIFTMVLAFLIVSNGLKKALDSNISTGKIG